MATQKPVPRIWTTSILHAAIYMSDKFILDAESNVLEKLPPFELRDTTPKDINGPNRTKLMFWFDDSQDLKRVMLAFTNKRLLVDASAFNSKYNELRDMTLNKTFVMVRAER